ncbi:molybdopterin-dependent oxidoreductase [Paenibacillus sp. IB182496]|uniref:Molybdopterin-dependent oxidoreductase n=1 Tax=Paenibacillus sabuli TaxID=2772509 RepID=A0A927BRP8_9BACL|nr:molybdopterin-dependent oxidoreductase [Paenibacillus sabuli]MBD2845532.1 molybdopterin-dependent oxidoreductase [Paenibacillus sabuli]
MNEWLKRLRKGYGKKLVALHTWNGWIVVLLALSGLVLLGGYWRGVLGEGRVWLKWIHIVIGIVSILPIAYYLALAGKHWKQLRGKPWQKFNVYVVLFLLVGWLLSGLLLWQFRLVGPAVANAALVVHDLLTWVGLPYIIYHSLTRVKWLKDPNRRTVQAPRPETAVHPAATPQPVYTRRAFIRGAVGVGLAVTVGPSFVKWLGEALGTAGGSNLEQLVENDANQLLPAPQPLPASAPPLGGGAQGSFRVYTVTPIPSFTNANWSLRIDGLVDKPQQWDWATFVKLKRAVQVSDFHCVTGWSVYNNTWEGIPVKDMLEMAGVKGTATSAIFHSGDGVYTSGISLEQLAQDDAMIAVLHDGKPIPSDLGGPVRLVMPKMYAYKSVKWLSRIELIEGTHIGYWEQRGYKNEAWV